MKLAQFFDKEGNLRIGMLDEQLLFPLTFSGDMLDFIAQRPEARRESHAIPLEEVRFALAVLRPTKKYLTGH